ncbi:Serpin B3, partial [Cyphomyrmex costatus]
LCLLIATGFIKEDIYAVAQNSAQTNISSQINPQVEDDEDFVPYQGEHFSVFDWMLFRSLSKTNKGNVLLSPISIKLALVLLYEGAQDQTAYELAGVMHLPVSPLAIREKFNNILKSLQTPSPTYTLNLGSRIYIDDNILTRQRYAATIKTFYNTDVINVNLSDTHAIATKVNSWVSNITNGHIEKMIDDEKGLEDSVMLIVNGLFFKGAWRRKYFAPENSRISKFYINTNESVNVPYMHTVSRFYYVESSKLDAKILRIPYDGSKFAMYIILPHTMTGVDHIVNEINSFTLGKDIWSMQELPLDVWIPKFKFEFTSHLENTLRELGIRDIFDDTALLTGIAKTRRASRRLRVSDVVHKTGIEMNENGTTAYAATEIQIGNKIEEGTFHANHPFVFYIEDETTGTILYVGKVQNPLNTSGTTGKVQQEFPSRFNPDAATVTPNSVVPAVLSTEDRYSFFNIDLLQRINENVEGNLILSPVSAKIALTSLVEGTGGRTRHELLAALRLPEEEYIIRRIAERSLIPLKSQQNGTEIDVATCLWINPALAASTNYMTALNTYYGTNIQKLNFGNTNHAANTINSWVRENTRNNIKTIIQPGTLSADTQMLLTSSLYFKGRWLKSFDKDATRIRCFHVPQSGCQDVLMMENSSKYRYGNIGSLDADVVEIPYSNGRTSMLIILPSHKESDPYLQILVKDLSYVPIKTLLTSLNETELILAIPKFSIESKLDLRSPLMHMGVQDIFSVAANFTGIVFNEYLLLANIIQNAKIEVDEEGTIAAAVTELAVVPLMANIVPTFIANRPFIFIIVDLITSETLFAGRFMGPNADNSRGTI